MRLLDILGNDKRGDGYHWYAVDIEARTATNEGCCSVTGKGAKCPGFEDEKSAKKAGDACNAIVR